MIRCKGIVSGMKQKFELYVKYYWNYYLQIEKEVLETRKFVEFDESNYKSFSIEFLKLYQVICSEIDVIGKSLAAMIDVNFKPTDKNNNIYKWWYILQNNLFLSKNISDGWNDSVKVNVRSCTIRNYIFNINANPWGKFEIERYADKKGKIRFRSISNPSVPSWWSDYNKVKHNRTILSHSDNNNNYDKANLKNVIDSLTALYVLEIALLQQSGTKNDLQSFVNESKMFEKILWCTDEEIEKLF